MTKLNGWKMAARVLALCIATATALSGQTLTTLADFTNGAEPLGSLIQGPGGKLYGTTGGTVFSINIKNTLSTLYTFCRQPNCTDGESVNSGLVLATNGNYYGTTSSGGEFTRGTVFQITSNGTLTTLYSFCAQPNCIDGVSPVSGLLQASDGNLYGSTDGGGANNLGTIFRISTTGVFTSLYSFCVEPNCSDGALPQGTLIQASDGNLYGTTATGGVGGAECSDIPPGCGTIFRLSLAGKLTTVYRFKGTDGSSPVGGVVQSTDGTFYGTTSAGGITNSNCPGGCGTVFKITRQGELATLYEFCAQTGCTDGLNPEGALIQGTDENLYGVTSFGGIDSCDLGCGTLFTINEGGELTTLYSFCTEPNCADGSFPSGALWQATNGMFYGATKFGGTGGTIFSLDMGLGPFVTFVRREGRVGKTGGILGQGFTGTTSVAINSVQAEFNVVSDTYIKATVPAGATTGYVTVTTPSRTLTSNVPFHVIP